MLNFDRGLNFEQKCTPLPDPPDPSHGLLFGTYHPSRAGVRMTVVLNKLPQINLYNCTIFDLFASVRHHVLVPAASRACAAS